MAFNIFEPKHLLIAAKELPRDTRLFQKRYFNESVMLHADKVLVEYKDMNKLVAPAVVDRSSGLVVQRKGFKAFEMEPAKISVKRAMDSDDIKRIAFGEDPTHPKTPEQRQSEMVAEDLVELGDMIDRAEELIAVNLMLNNSVSLDLYNADGKVVDTFEVRYYDGANPDNIYTPTTKWDAAGADILGDLGAMIEMLAKRGLPATEIVVSPDVANVIQKDPEIREILDNRRFELGSIDPKELTDSSYQIGTLYPNGRKIDIITYVETYDEFDEDGNIVNKPYLPNGTVIMTAPGCGKKAYAQVTQVEQNDGTFHTYAQERVPKYTANADGNTRSLELTSRSLFMPKNQNAWIVANVMTTTS